MARWAYRRDMIRMDRRILIFVANQLGAGDGFHKHARKLALANFILEKAGLAGRRSERVFPLGNASST